MRLTAEAIAALALFAACVAYGLLALRIDVAPGQATEAFGPRTLPLALAIAGTGLCALQLSKSLRNPAATAHEWRAYDWPRAGALLVCMIAYGLLFDPLGFVVATVGFLAAGFAVLGERRWLLLILAPIGFTVVFWLLMTRGLGLYLAPGALFAAAGG